MSKRKMRSRKLAQQDFGAEFRLVAACCRWPHSESLLAEIAGLADRIDWPAFLGLARRHRVEGLVHHALKAASVDPPSAVSQALERRATAIATESLVQTAIALRIHERLVKAGIDHLFVKGSTLSIMAYGGLSVKQARDIDLLVTPEQAADAARLLKGEGFTLFHPANCLEAEEFALWMTHCKESAWTRGDTLVELHTALADNARLLAGLDARSPEQQVLVGPGRTLPTLKRDSLFAYLCVHGATHGWSRLKWLADLAAFAGAQGEQALGEMYLHAKAIGAGRSAAQAILLAQEILAMPVPKDLAAEIGGDRKNRWLAGLALRTMTGAGTEELDSRMLGTVEINLSHFLLGPGLGYKLTEVARKLSIAEDRVLLPLPRAFSFLYPLLALPMWVWRRRRAGRA